MRQSSKINFLIASLISLSAHAADLTTNKIEVISTTPLGGIGLTPDKIPADIKVVKGKKMQEQGSLTVADYMNTNMAGVSVTETQGNPYQPDVRYHGFNANALLGSPQGLSVYQDGVRVNEPFGDVVSWDLIPMNAIKEFQLIPGANPIYGRNTLGGSISLKTKRGRDVQGGAIELSGGSWNRKNTNFEYGNLDAKSGIDYFVSGNYFDEDGWRKASGTTVRQLFAQVGKQNDTTDVNFTLSMADNEMIGNGLTPHDLMDTTGRNAIYTKPDQTKNKNILMNLSGSHWLNNSTMLSANTYFRRTVTNTLNGDVNDDLEEFELNSTRAPGRAAAWDNACLGLSTGLIDNGKSTQSNVDSANRELFCSGRINYTDTRKTSTGFTLQASSNQKFFDKEHQITTGLAFDYSQVKFSQYGQYGLLNADRGVNPIDFFTEAGDESPKLKGRTYDWGLYGTDTISLNEKLNLTLAGRYNNTNVKNTDPNDPIHIDEGKSQNSLTGNHSFQRFNPSVGLTFNPSSDLKIYTSYSESNRAPTSMELGCANPAVPCKLPNAMAGDPPLKQVVNRSVDLGAKGALTKDINWSIGTYVSLNSDDIQFLTSPAASNSQGGYFSNVGDTLRKGIDFGLNGKVSKLRWSANYSFVKATYEDSFTIANDHNTEKQLTDCAGTSLGSSTATGVTDTSGNPVARSNYGICVNPGKEIPGIPNHQLKLRTDFQATPNWNIGATAIIFSDQWLHGVENNVFNPRAAVTGINVNSRSYQGNGRAGGYGVLNLDTRYKFDDSGWVAFARVNNVFDATYNTGGVQGASFYNAAGTTFLGDDNRRSLFAPGAPRAAWIGMRYEFGGAKKSSDD